MLIYNFKKEFIGIDENDLRNLGFSTLVEFQNKVNDFSDLFVKTPGYIHNFSHIHWIDYITCNDDLNAKAVVNIKEKKYSLNINIETIYLTDDPSNKAYIINLSKIAPLYDHNMTDTADKQEERNIATFNNSKENDLTLEIKKEKIPKPDKDHEYPQKNEKQVQVKLTSDTPGDYTYDPNIASQDLGLPIDLIEEFIEDFIAQAYSFQNELYESMKRNDMDRVKILSHKLKGVAANLRIEDALECLKNVNTSDNAQIIRSDLDRFYAIIRKLSKNGIPLETNGSDQKIETLNETEPPKEEIKADTLQKKSTQDDLLVSIKKDDTTSEEKHEDHMIIDDASVPESIEIPELADDEFLKQDEIYRTDLKDEDLSILDNCDETLNDDIYQEAFNNIFIYDKQQMAQDIGLSIESFNEMFEEYVKEAKAITSSIVDSADERNLRQCKSGALKLKSISKNMRINDFDNAVKSIVDAEAIASLKKPIEDIVSKLNIIANYKE
mgnify:CR=1 FL=1